VYKRQAQPETATQSAIKQAENLAYGEERKKGDIPFGNTLQVFGHHADKLGNMTHIPRRSTPMEVPRDMAPKEIAITAFLKSLRTRTESSITPELNKELKATFGTSINVEIAEAIIKDIEAGADWREQLQDADQVIAQ